MIFVLIFVVLERDQSSKTIRASEMDKLIHENEQTMWKGHNSGVYLSLMKIKLYPKVCRKLDLA